MKRLKLAILLLLIPLCCIAFAALSKTSTINDSEVDAWQKVLAGTLVVGNVGDISGSYDSIVYLEIPYTDIDLQSGVDVKVETSYGDDNWILFSEFTTPSGQADTTTLDGVENAGQTVISVIDGTNIDSPGQKWFIVDDTGNPEESESVRTKSANVNDITLCHDLIRSHASGEPVWSIVHEYIFQIPASFAKFRITIHNIDGDADIYFTTRKSEVDGL